MDDATRRSFLIMLGGIPAAAIATSLEGIEILEVPEDYPEEEYYVEECTGEPSHYYGPGDVEILDGCAEMIVSGSFRPHDCQIELETDDGQRYGKRHFPLIMQQRLDGTATLHQAVNEPTVFPMLKGRDLVVLYAYISCKGTDIARIHTGRVDNGIGEITFYENEHGIVQVGHV